jgi:hypothetical protein
VVDLSDLSLQVYQNGYGPEFLKSEFLLQGTAPVGSYIIVTRDVDPVGDSLLQFTGWSAMWDPALPLGLHDTISQFLSTENSWQVNGTDDPVALVNADGVVIDMAAPVKDHIATRQADGTWVESFSSVWATGAAAPIQVSGVSGPVYVYEIGEKGPNTDLINYQGNYVILYVAGP